MSHRYSKENERTFGKLLDRLGVSHAYAYLKKRYVGFEAVIVMYHRISPHNDPWSIDALNPGTFEKQLQYLRSNYTILSLRNLVDHIHARKPLPQRIAVVTFDDGYKDNFTYAFPLLKKYRVPATVFVATGYPDSPSLFWWDKVGYALLHTQSEELKISELGTFTLEAMDHRRATAQSVIQLLMKMTDESKNLTIDELLTATGTNIPESLAKQVILSWDEVTEMSRAGIDIGAHSVAHPVLTNMPLERATREIIESRSEIIKRVKRPVDLFAYPDGASNPEIAEAVEQAGFIGAVTSEPSWITYRSNPYLLGRIATSSHFGLFKLKLSGILGDYEHLRLLIGRAQKQTQKGWHKPRAEG